MANNQCIDRIRSIENVAGATLWWDSRNKYTSNTHPPLIISLPNWIAQLERDIIIVRGYLLKRLARTGGRGGVEEDVLDVVYRVFHRISRRVSTGSGEWKRNKVLARTKSERDRCIIPVLLTAPPQSRSPAPSSLFIPLPLRPPHRSTHNNLFEFHFIPYGYAARRPTATPAPPTSPSTFPSRANPDRIRHFFFTFLFHVSFRAFTRFSGHEKVRNSSIITREYIGERR